MKVALNFKNKIVIFLSFVINSYCMIKNKSKIVLVTNDLYSGGSQKICVNLSNELSNTHDVDLIVIGKNLNLLNKINKKVNVINLGFNRVSLSFFELFKYFFKFGLTIK